MTAQTATLLIAAGPLLGVLSWFLMDAFSGEDERRRRRRRR